MHPGENIVRRKSTESTVTIPYEQTFRNIDRKRPLGEIGPTSPEAFAFDFCGCGWPQHLLGLLLRILALSC